MCAPSAPAPPDYAAAAQQQGAANLDAANATAHYNNPNITDPYGTQTTTWGGNNFDQNGYNAAMAKYNTDLSNYNSSPSSPVGGNVFGTGAGTKSGSLSGPMQHTGVAPTAPTKEQFGYDPLAINVNQTLNPQQQALLDKQTQVKGLLGSLGVQGATSLQDILGKPFDISGAPAIGNGQQARDQVINAMMSRSNQDLGKQWDQTNSDLVARGIAPGTAAYQREQDLQARAQNDAEQQAQIAGGNAASQQQGMDVTARNQYLSGLLSQRQTPLNEITALMSGSQVSNPFAGNLGYQGGVNVQPAPVMQGAQMQGQNAMDLYNVNSQNQNAMMSGLFGLGGAGIMASDRRLKTNIRRIGTHELGIGIYEYDYIWGEHSKGVMADELETVYPQAVRTDKSGYKLVDYAMIGGLNARYGL